MTTTQLVLCSTSIAVAGAAFFVAHNERQTLEAQRRQHESAITRTAAEISRLSRDIEKAEAAHAELERTRESAPPPPGALVAQETSAWLARLRQLKQALAERPGARIPEMSLLTERDYLLAAREASFASDEDIRRTLSSLRTTATRKVAPLLAKAVAEYVRLHPNSAPPDLAALSPHLSQPLSLDLLSRWGVISSNPAQHVVAERIPVDAEFDTRTVIQGNGGWGAQGAPLAWIPDFAERNRAAHAAYNRAHHGATAPGLGALLPYFDPPLPAEIAARLQRMTADATRR